MRVVFANFYSMLDARRRYLAGSYPAQYLFGAIALEEAGHDVSYADPSGGLSAGLVDPLARRLRGRLGHMQPQVSALRRARRNGVLFGVADETLAGLALLRAAGALKQPVATVYHHPPARSRLARRAVLGYDLVFTLSTESRDALIAMGRSPERTLLLNWGPQLDFPPYGAPRGDEYVMSCGKSRRDIDVLAKAVAPTDVPALIYAPPGWAKPSNDGGIRVRHVPQMPPYETVMEEMARASVVTVPLQSTDRMYGLSEVNDALAIGKPIVMTRTPHLDLDLDAIGCGHLIEPGDVEGWRKALIRLHGDDKLRRKMGQRARTFAEQEWNADVCARQIVDGLGMLDGRP